MEDLYKLPLSRDKVVLVDRRGYVLAHRFKWSYVTTRGGHEYAFGYMPCPQCKTVYLHRFLMGNPKGLQIDHINGDGLDCRFSNMRVATRRQNQQNRHRSYGTSKYKGVCWNKTKRKWLAQIRAEGRRRHLGTFDTEEEAARAYNKAALECFGEFAQVNKL